MLATQKVEASGAVALGDEIFRLKNLRSITRELKLQVDPKYRNEILSRKPLNLTQIIANKSSFLNGLQNKLSRSRDPSKSPAPDKKSIWNSFDVKSRAEPKPVKMMEFLKSSLAKSYIGGSKLAGDLSQKSYSMDKSPNVADSPLKSSVANKAKGSNRRIFSSLVNSRIKAQSKLKEPKDISIDKVFKEDRVEYAQVRDLQIKDLIDKRDNNDMFAQRMVVAFDRTKARQTKRLPVNVTRDNITSLERSPVTASNATPTGTNIAIMDNAVNNRLSNISQSSQVSNIANKMQNTAAGYFSKLFKRSSSGSLLKESRSLGSSLERRLDNKMHRSRSRDVVEVKSQTYYMASLQYTYMRAVGTKMFKKHFDETIGAYKHLRTRNINCFQYSDIEVKKYQIVHKTLPSISICDGILGMI